MKSQEQFCNSNYAAEMDIAERELFAFIGAVTQLFGPEEAKLSAEDWLDESELTASPPRSTNRNWRAVTIAASARLANRLAVAQHREIRSPQCKNSSGSSRHGFAARRSG